MPVTFTVTEHSANPVKDPYQPMSSADSLLNSTWGVRSRTVRSKGVIQTSMIGHDFARVHAMGNGFVDTVRAAYDRHHHLIIRPDDVWIAILSQFNFYVNAHAEELRSHFVQHQGKQKLVVGYGGDWGEVAVQLTSLIDKNVSDKSLKDWIIPNFTTTSTNDTIICSVLMMSTLKAYFSYGAMICCGIPSVTLEGEKEDWERLLLRLTKLEEFGEEPKAWANLLRPILRRFAAAFDGQPDVEFWQRVCHVYNNGSGPSYLSGWLTAFCVWTSEGKWQGPSLKPMPALAAHTSRSRVSRDINQGLVLDDTRYSQIDLSKVPSGYCEVDVEFDDDGNIHQYMMVSGHLASLVEGDLKDTVRPLPSWFIFEKEECEDPEEVFFRKFMAEHALK